MTPMPPTAMSTVAAARTTAGSNCAARSSIHWRTASSQRFALALASSWPLKRVELPDHLSRARAGAKKDSLLATNLESHFSGNLARFWPSDVAECNTGKPAMGVIWPNIGMTPLPHPETIRDV